MGGPGSGPKKGSGGGSGKSRKAVLAKWGIMGSGLKGKMKKWAWRG
jgi:hypothetical protein